MNRLQSEIQAIKEYEQLPLIECYSAQLNQVSINVLVNAVGAPEESNQGRSYQEIAANPNTIRI